MQTGLICFEIVSKLNQQDVDIRSIIREYGLENKDVSKEELLRIAKNTGFKAKLKKIQIDNFPQNYPLPAIVLLKDSTFAVILKINFEEKKALMFIPGVNDAQDKSFDELDQILSSEFIILSHKLMSDNIKFGFQWFFAEILRYKKIILEVFVGSFVVQLFGLVTPLFTQVILDKVIVNRTLSTLVVLAVAFLVVTLFELLLNLSRNYIFIHTANKIDSKLGSKLFKQLFSLPFIYFETRKVGNIIARIRELDTIREFVTSKSVSVIIDLIFSSVFLLVMFLYSPLLTAIVVGFVLVVATLYLIVTPELRNRLQSKFEMGAQSNSYLVETVTGIQTVKSLAIEGTMQKKWENYLGNYLKSSFDLSIIGNFTGSISGFLQKIMTISILYVGVKLVISNKLTIGQLIAFQMFAGQFSGPVIRLVNLWNEFQQALLGVDRLGDILNHPVEIQSAQAITLPQVQGSIKFDNVSFKYNVGSPLAIDGLSCFIKPGSHIGIVGRSGSGKSTITKLIQRLYYANEGAIYIDDIDIRHMNPYWLRYNIGIVLQESFLFSGTIRDNITMPMPNAPIEHVIEVSKIAGAHEFISQLPEGYDTMVGERGSSLSGGQKQRIAIARALITNPRFLIFDEATSALDYESEKIIQQNIEKIKKNRTMLVIAHRLSTVEKCDLIIAMDKGKIIEAGTHSELINKKGYYYHLYTQQAHTV